MARETLESICQKAQTALSQGHYQEARDFYERALAARADHPEAHYGIATVYFLLGDLEASAHHFREVTRFDPTKAGAYINLGAVYNRLEKYDDSIAALRRGISLDHTRAEGYYNLGLVYRKRDQLDMAIQAYREATRVNPRMADAHYNIANIYLERGQINLALAHYRHALEVRPNWEKALRGLENAEQLLDEQEHQEEQVQASAAASSDSAIAASELVPTAPVRPDRVVDPQAQGELLRALHRATIDADSVGRDLIQSLMEQMEPAIKDLSTALLYPNSSVLEIQESVKRFESALVKLRSVEETMENSVERVRLLGEQMVKS